MELFVFRRFHIARAENASRKRFLECSDIPCRGGLSQRAHGRLDRDGGLVNQPLEVTRAGGFHRVSLGKRVQSLFTSHPMTPNPRLLFVDDEPGIRATLPAILGIHGFDVTAAATVPEALAAIQSQTFDILLADLNIGEPGDGFTVVSAMRRTQPGVVTIILTGYPAFESALNAIRSQVDDYLVKPADIPKLVEMLREKLEKRQPKASLLLLKPAGDVVRENHDEIIRRWLECVKKDEELHGIELSDKERTDHLPLILEGLTQLPSADRSGMFEIQAEAAVNHGRIRKKQGYSVDMLAQEMNYLRDVVSAVLQEHLLEVDISRVIPDLVHMNDILDHRLRASIRAFMGNRPQPTLVGRRKT
jgi:ActR/RegA family two-component response regulator